MIETEAEVRLQPALEGTDTAYVIVLGLGTCGEDLALRLADAGRRRHLGDG